MCLTKLLVMKKEFCMVIAFAMALAGLCLCHLISECLFVDCFIEGAAYSAALFHFPGIK